MVRFSGGGGGFGGVTIIRGEGGESRTKDLFGGGVGGAANWKYTKKEDHDSDTVRRRELYIAVEVDNLGCCAGGGGQCGAPHPRQNAAFPGTEALWAPVGGGVRPPKCGAFTLIPATGPRVHGGGFWREILETVSVTPGPWHSSHLSHPIKLYTLNSIPGQGSEVGVTNPPPFAYVLSWLSRFGQRQWGETYLQLMIPILRSPVTLFV
jgi:hypothetical protein